jgi:hypothetical protein
VIGELHATFEFATAAEAKAAWERITEAGREISVNRWALELDLGAAVLVTVLTEEGARSEFDKACALCAHDGTVIETPDWALNAFIAKRTRTPGRRTVRTPLGNLLDESGRSVGILKRPQG